MSITTENAKSDPTASAPAPAPLLDDGDTARGLVRLGIGLAVLVGGSVALGIGRTVAVIAAILTMIMLHELGHFLMARRAGMRVTEFFLGFGPKVWSVRRGDTEFGIRAIPAGGYVRVIGMNNLEQIDPADEPFTYRSKSYWQRVRFASAGSAVHFMIAFVLLVVVLAGLGRVENSTPPSTTIAAVSGPADFNGAPSPAAAAGLRSGDKVVAIDGQTIKAWEESSGLIRSHAGQSIAITVERRGVVRTVTVTPIDGRTAAQRSANAPAFGRVGIAPVIPVTKLSLPLAVWRAGFEMKDLTKETLGGLVNMFSGSSLRSYSHQLGETGPANPAKEGNRFLSPVGLVHLADTTAASGLSSVLMLLVLINIFVGIFNMLPLPPFDGGHVAVATYEAIRSRRSGSRHMIDTNRLLPVAWVMIAVLMLISVSALWLDVVHPFKLG